MPHFAQLELLLKLLGILLELPNSPFIKEVVLANASLIKLRNALVYSNQGYWVAGNFKPFQKGVFSPALIIYPEHFF